MVRTASLHGSADDLSVVSGTPAIYRLLECERPRSDSSQHLLEDSVDIGRTEAREVRREGGRLVLGVEDKAMSAAHARITRDGRRFIIEDVGSRNGVFVNGEKQQRATLVDGDVFDTGSTLWLFRASVPARESDLDASELPERLPGLRTFVPALAEAYDALAKVAGISILLDAESGTGKEVCARAIHRSRGGGGPFVAVNCGALPPTLVTSELFGYRKGAFSGATEDRIGLVRSADGGTLFLDEIADLPLASQALLLRVLQEREVTPIGATAPVPVDIQVIAASHRDLKALVKQELFRHDLYARLAGFTARLVPLRARREDFGLLVAALLERAPRGAAATLTINSARALLQYAWPLNVRELENALAVGAALAEGGTIHRRHLPAEITGTETIEDEPKKKAELVALLREHAGNISAIAKATGENRVQIHRWLKRFGIDPDPFRGK